jgi:creatinine amidohydrolase/Fe(II)-dependent formamide hydrolase-like protein
MSIRPDLIKGKGIKNFSNIPKFEIISDPEKYFPSGVMGDPTISSNLIGNKINKHIIDQIVKLVKDLMD